MSETVLELRVHPGRWAVCRLPAGANTPEPVPGVPLWSVTSTASETSLVVPEQHAPPSARVESGYAAIEVLGPLDFALTGILAGLATALAEAGVPLLAISTFDTDWLLVRHERLDEALAAIGAAGHRVSSALAAQEPDETLPLEPDRQTRERWLAAVSGFVQAHLDGLEQGPSVGTVGSAGTRIGAEVSVSVPEEPLPGGIDEALERLGRAVAASLNTAGPGYLAYIPGGGIHASALADYWSNSTNRFTGLTAAAPGLARLEWDVIAWLAAEFGYGPEARGLLTSGGSLANLSAVVTARETRLGRDADLRTAVAYTSTQAHHSVAKCLRLAGFPRESLRLIPVDSRWRMDAAALAGAIAEDRAAGRRPFLVVAAGGTTNTGAIDPLPAIAEICEREKPWLHVDGAYGGAFVLCDEGRERLRGLSLADSITFDPHKGMFLPYGTGCLLVRDGAALREAHAEGAAYLQDFEAWEREGEAPSPTDHGPELSRDYRGLRLWLPLMLHGARAFRDQAAEKLSLAATIDEGIERLIEGGAPLEVVDRAQLSISSFRLRRLEGEALSSWNARNATLLGRINGRERVYLSSTALPVVDGEAFTLRTCVLSFRTHARHCDHFLQDLAASLDEP